MPGNVTSKNSFGTNYLIKSAGAKLVQTWQDVVAELPREVAAALLPPASEGEGASAAAARKPPEMNDAERAVFRLLTADEPAHIDALCTASRLGLPELTAALLALEMRDLVRQLPGRCFVKRV